MKFKKPFRVTRRGKLVDANGTVLCWDGVLAWAEWLLANFDSLPENFITEELKAQCFEETKKLRDQLRRP